MNLKKRKALIIILLIAVFMLAAATILLSSRTTVAKWRSAFSGTTNAKVAAFVVDVNEQSSDQLNINCNQGQNIVTYQFSVSNKKNDATSEVAIDYKVIVSLPNELPEGLSMEIDGVKGVAGLNKKIYTFTHDTWTFKPSIAKENVHRLTFTADPTILDYNFDMEDIAISVKLQQIN